MKFEILVSTCQYDDKIVQRIKLKSAIPSTLEMTLRFLFLFFVFFLNSWLNIVGCKYVCFISVNVKIRFSGFKKAFDGDGNGTFTNCKKNKQTNKQTNKQILLFIFKVDDTGFALIKNTITPSKIFKKVC